MLSLTTSFREMQGITTACRSESLSLDTRMESALHRLQEVETTSCLGLGSKPWSGYYFHVFFKYFESLSSLRCCKLHMPQTIQIFVIYSQPCIAGVPSSDEAWGAGHHDAHIRAKHDVCLRLSCTSVLVIGGSSYKIDTEENHAIEMIAKPWKTIGGLTNFANVLLENQAFWLHLIYFDH